MTRARAGAMQSANSRGLLNSSMAAGAGEAAVIDAALPIAQQDANTFSQQRLANQQVSNAADQFGADAANRTVALNTGESEPKAWPPQGTRHYRNRLANFARHAVERNSPNSNRRT